jgi:hypothetical protein
MNKMIKNKLGAGNFMIIMFIILGIIVLWVFISIFLGIDSGVSSTGILSFLSI